MVGTFDVQRAVLLHTDDEVLLHTDESVMQSNATKFLLSPDRALSCLPVVSSRFAFCK